MHLIGRDGHIWVSLFMDTGPEMYYMYISLYTHLFLNTLLTCAVYFSTVAEQQSLQLELW